MYDSEIVFDKTKELLSKHIPTETTEGMQYLCEMVAIVINDPKRELGVTLNVYGKIAKNHDVTLNRVMTQACATIRVIGRYDRNENPTDTLFKKLDVHIDDDCVCPTLREFIYGVSDVIRKSMN